MRERLTIGEVAKLTGVTTKTVRHYHKIGLLSEPDRSDSEYKLYPADTLFQLSLEEDGVHLRHGTFAEGFIPYSVIERVERKRMKAPGSGDGLITEDRDAFFTIAGHTDITLALSGPRRLHGFLRPTDPVDTVHLTADTPERFLEDLKGRVGLSLTENKKVSKT